MAGKRVHHEEHEEHADESWLVPYADVLTLLLALFIVLFASSSADQEKFTAMAEAFYTAFNGEPPGGGPGGSALPNMELIPYPTLIPPGGDEEGAGEALGSLYTSIQEYVFNNSLENTISVEQKGESVLITLRNDVWFESGSIELSPEMSEKAKPLARLLEENFDPNHPYEVIVAGHTDNVPMNVNGYTNWDLSFDRAKSFLKLLLGEMVLDPALFSGRGEGEYHPIDTNDTEEGRSRNRRVEIYISQKIVQS